jgi:glucose/arabinose dehydrogenase
VMRDGVLDPSPWAVLPAAAGPDQERGLLGLALDPDFPNSGFVYTYYTTLASGRFINRLVRMRDEAGRGVVDRVLLDGIPGANTHDGGRLKFGPDQRLYITVGDAEAGQLAQDPASPSGKILRLEKDGSIPVDNPFAGSPVFSLGHRHPQGLAFHPDGALYATEHGPSEPAPRCCHDEVNQIQPGANYGWPRVFGVAKNPQFRDPLHESGTDTWAPSGAAFITDGALRGSLMFATLRGQHLHRLVLSADGASVVFEERLLSNQFGRLRDVVEAPDGALYVLTQNRDGRGQPRAGDDRVLRVVLR